MRILYIICIAENRKCILGFLFYFFTERNLVLPQFIDDAGKPTQRYQIIRTIRGCEFLIPVLHLFDIVRLQLLDDFIGIVTHPRITHQKMINLAVSGFLFTFCTDRHSFRRTLIPA